MNRLHHRVDPDMNRIPKWFGEDITEPALAMAETLMTLKRTHFVRTFCA